MAMVIEPLAETEVVAELELRISRHVEKGSVACRYDAGRSAQGKTTLHFVARMRGSAVRDDPRTGRFSERPRSAWVTFRHIRVV
jgi:hypothetical protein